MKISAKLKYLGILGILLLSSCGETIIKSPNEDGGLGGNEAGDQVVQKDATALKDFLLAVGKNQYYSYEVSANVLYQSSHFVDYFTPNAFYELHDDPSLSFGMAQEKGNNSLFKYYFDSNNEVVPSIYYYDSTTGEKIKGLYNPITLANLTMLPPIINEEFSAEVIGTNKFVLTSGGAISIFQYMTTFGASIMDYFTGIIIEIHDYDSLLFTCTVDLGMNGSIVCKYKPYDTAIIDDVNAKVTDGTIKGVDGYDDVTTFFNTVKSNNYKLEGIKQNLTTGETFDYTRDIYCTNNYFFIDYTDRYQAQALNWGFAFIEAGKEITYHDFDQNYNIVKTYKKTLDYDACYGFIELDGELYFDTFVGPLEQGGIKYKTVDELPEVGDPGILYIIYNEETGKKDVYEYTTDGSHSSYTYYSTWQDDVGEFYINNAYATFYFDATALTNIGPMFFEKDLTKENSYYCRDNSVISNLCNSIFGWGFQQTTTWMDYAFNSHLDIRKDSSNNIEEVDVILDVQASVNENSGTQQIYYTVKDFNEVSLPNVEAFIERGGANA